jgi:hypothetical protein
VGASQREDAGVVGTEFPGGSATVSMASENSSTGSPSAPARREDMADRPAGSIATERKALRRRRRTIPSVGPVRTELAAVMGLGYIAPLAFRGPIDNYCDRRNPLSKGIN